MTRKNVNRLIDICCWGLMISGVVLLLLAGGHCSTTPKKNNTTCWLPEGCVTQYQDNPYTYKVGAVSVSGYPDDAITLRIQPLATYGLFTEDVLICDRAKIGAMFEGKHNPIVLTYKTKASHLVQGVGCHELIRVDEMKTVQP